MKLGNINVVINVTQEDIDRGECGERAHCVIAQAIDRQFKLGGKGYIRVDANGWSATKDGIRYGYHSTHTMARYLRMFDELGAEHGVEKARTIVGPRRFGSKLVDVRPVTRSTTPERRAQINAARNRKLAAAKEKGIAPKKYLPRYVGV